MIEFLSAAFVILILVVFIALTAVAAFLHLLAGKGRPAITWMVACSVGTVILILAIGGLNT